MNVSRMLCALCLLFVPCIPLVAATVPAEPTEEELMLDEIAGTIRGVGAPYVRGDYVIFTAKKDAHHVGIAFDFEQFRTIHSYKLRTVYDSEYNPIDQFYFYVHRLPKQVQVVQYRMVIDGLWICDPLNKNRVYNGQTGLELSQVNAHRDIPLVTGQSSTGTVRFIYKGASGQEIRLAGNFTNWDSWIYRLKEIENGIYECDLSLPPGTYQYVFYNGVTPLVDPDNPKKVYTPDGRTASVVVVPQKSD